MRQTPSGMPTLPDFPAQRANARTVLASPPLPIAPSNHGKFYNIWWCAHDPVILTVKTLIMLHRVTSLLVWPLKV